MGNSNETEKGSVQQQYCEKHVKRISKKCMGEVVEENLWPTCQLSSLLKIRIRPGFQWQVQDIVHLFVLLMTQLNLDNRINKEIQWFRKILEKDYMRERNDKII